MVDQKLTNRLGRAFTMLCAGFIILTTLSIIVFIASKGLSTFIVDRASIRNFLLTTVWRPDAPKSEGGPLIGALPFIAGSVAVSLLALIIIAPFSIGVAIFMSEISPAWGRKILQPVIEVFVGIPSVVYGWIGLSVLVPFIRNHIGGLGFSLLAGSIVLAIMIFPTIASVSTDSLQTISRDIREASLALGATRWQTIRMVLLPAALPGILTGVVLGLARAFGEALAVQMVIGNAVRMPDSLLKPVHTMTSIITMEMSNTVMGTVWNDALWSIALLLMLISFMFIMFIRFIESRGAAK
ncbi:MAG: phosphate ABC transporter permease subunit PstC [Tepidanaerobacteraceae bacterium]|jgi:phosphate transport system permease protein|nr:phosphate ABC transporter permease subunit PstC [Tepidanaerobacteraceae bacterium]